MIDKTAWSDVSSNADPKIVILQKGIMKQSWRQGEGHPVMYSVRRRAISLQLVTIMVMNVWNIICDSD